MLKRLKAIITKYGDLIERVNVPPWVKSALFHDFVLPKINYSFSIWTFAAQQLRQLDFLVRRYAKRFELLRASFNNAQVHAPRWIGGLGYIAFEHSAPILYAIPHLRRLFIADAQVSSVERASLFDMLERISSLSGHSVLALLHDSALFALLLDEHAGSD